MRLVSVHLQNFCQHRDLLIEFPPGITGILGGNGRGKSNAVKAIRFALIGDSANEGPRAEDMNWHAPEGERGSVTLEFEQNGTPGRIKRAVNQTRTSLKFGEESINSTAAANARILDIMGVTKKTVEEIIFVMQGEIESVLFERPADRAKKFQRLFGTEEAERIRVLLQQEISRLPEDPAEDRIKELEARLADDIDVKLKALNEQRESTQATIDDVDEDALQEAISDYEHSARLKRALEEAEQDTVSLMARLSRASGDADQLKTQATQTSERLASLRAEAEDARSSLASLESAKKLYISYSQLIERVNDCNAVLGETPPEEPNLTRDNLREFEKAFAESSVKIEQTEQVVREFDENQQSKCPTCDRPVDREYVERKKHELHALRTSRDKAESLLMQARHAWSQYDHARASFDTRRAQAGRVLKLTEQQLQQMGEVKPVDDESLTKIRQKVDELTKLEADAEQAAEAANQAAVEVARLKAKYESRVAERERIADELGETSGWSDVIYAQAKEVLYQYKMARQHIANIEGQLEQLCNHRANTLAELEGLRQQTASIDAAKKYRELCERSRLVLHRDALPRVVVNKFLVAINRQLSRYAEHEFNLPFKASIEDDLSAVCHFPGVGAKPAGRASGGEKVMLGISFRFSIDDLFAEDLGFMVLDEPTNMLAGDRVQAVKELLDKVRRHAHRSGRQIIVITHEEELVPSFDHVVRL